MYDENEIKSAKCDYETDIHEDNYSCKEVKPFQGEEFLHYMMNVVFGKWVDE